VSVARTSDSFSPPITWTCPVFTMYISFPTSPCKYNSTICPEVGNFCYPCKWMVWNGSIKHKMSQHKLMCWAWHQFLMEVSIYAWVMTTEFHEVDCCLDAELIHKKIC
jgi:hypothetical protein